MDRLLLVIILLLAGILAAFFAGLIPYPFGVIVLSLFLAARLFAIAARKEGNR